MVQLLFLIISNVLPRLITAMHNSTNGGCAIIRPPRDGGIRYRGLTQEQIRSVEILPVDYEIEYICRGNRVIIGPKVRKCLPDGTWTDMDQQSRCLFLCPHTWTSLENGRVTLQPSGPPVEGTVLRYSCHAGFLLEGRNISHCTKQGNWDSPKPLCAYDRNYTALQFPFTGTKRPCALFQHDDTPAPEAPELHEDMVCYCWSERTLVLLKSLDFIPTEHLWDELEH